MLECEMRKCGNVKVELLISNFAFPLFVLPFPTGGYHHFQLLSCQATSAGMNRHHSRSNLKKT